LLLRPVCEPHFNPAGQAGAASADMTDESTVRSF
jgi:hypothetical protein